MVNTLNQHGEIVQQYDELNTFFKKYNKVLLDKLSIDHEKQHLKQENIKLKRLLKIS